MRSFKRGLRQIIPSNLSTSSSYVLLFELRGRRVAGANENVTRLREGPNISAFQLKILSRLLQSFISFSLFHTSFQDAVPNTRFIAQN